MSHRIACYTLFDITKTGVLNRAKPGTDIEDVTAWYHKRSTQCNFDTIIQIISLRSQPEVVSDPKLIKIDINQTKFGSDYTKYKQVNCWTFDFEVHHSSVFEDTENELGALYSDCDKVPMINTDTNLITVNNYLDLDKATRNIYFVKY